MLLHLNNTYLALTIIYQSNPNELSFKEALILRKTSETVKQIIDNIHPSVIIKLNVNYSNDHNTYNKIFNTIFNSIKISPTWCNIKKLDISRSFYKGKYSFDSLKHFTEILKTLTEITHLDLSYNQMGLDMESVFEAMKNFTKLTHLNLSENSLALVDMNKLVKILEKNINLSYLNIGYNFMNKHEIEKIVNNLNYCPNLSSLNLRFNKISKTAIKILGNNILNITDLNLSEIIISEIGIECFAEMIGKLKKLSRLELVSNDINDNDIKIIAKKLNSKLAHLNLNKNQITDYGVKSIIEIINICPELSYLNIESNLITEIGNNNLEQIIKNKNICYKYKCINIDNICF
jgi:Ran GTPase-activating protein (RanGAP) involved in mRNA processing and transport